MPTDSKFLRRMDAAAYVKTRWGLPCSPRWLAKLVVTGGGPTYRKAGAPRATWMPGRRRGSAPRKNRPQSKCEVARMGKRSPNPRLAKTHRNYTVGEIAALYKVRKNTVLAWRDAGLTPIADRRKPLLFLGADLSAFLGKRRLKNKRPLRPGQIYCVGCRDAKEPAYEEAEYVPSTPTSGNLRGLCPACARLIHRRVSRTNLAAVQGQLRITFTDAPLSIGDAVDPSVNRDFEAVEMK
jgi:hypothetical protein